MLILTDMAPKKTSKHLSKSDFIRQQPPTMSAADVIARGKEAGLRFTSSLVYRVRGRPLAKNGARSSAPKKAASAKKKPRAGTNPVPGPAISTEPTQSKADFVRGRAHLSPKEIVEDADAAGIKLDATYVYNVRGYDKTMAKKKRSAKSASSKARTSNRLPRGTAKTPRGLTSPAGEQLPPDPRVVKVLKAAAAELGIGLAVAILVAERASILAAIGG